MYKFWDRAIAFYTQCSSSWGFPFQFLITHLQSYSHMPREHQVQVARAKRVATGAELMDMDGHAAEEEMAKEGETVTLGVSLYLAIQKELADL
jgi:hypothetical protein